MILASHRPAITNVTVNYVVVGGQKFSENMNVWQVVFKKPYNMWS